MIRERWDHEFRVTSYSYDYEYTLPLCLQLALCPRGAAHTTYGVEPGADMSCCAHLFINLGCCCVQMSGGHWTSRMRRWICLWEWRYEASAHSATQNVIKTEAAYKEMPLDDLWGSLLCLERMEPTARRALGGAHPETAALEKSLQNARAAARAREKLYRKAIELDSNNAAAHNNLGLLLQTGRKDYDDAEQHYREAIELDPKHAWAHNNLGWLLHDVRKDYDGAEKLYRKAIELDPSNAKACWNLSRILENQKNDIAGAVKLMEECVRLGPWHGRMERLAQLRAKL